MAHHNIGVQLAQRGDLPQALVELETASGIDPDFIQNKLALAYVLKRLGRPAEALANYRRAVELGETDPEILADYAALQKTLPK